MSADGGGTAPHEREVSFPVWDMYRPRRAELRGVPEQERQRAFERAEGPPGERLAKSIFREEVAEQGGKRVRITKAEFVEFDSTNVSHAGAYWNIFYEGDELLHEE